VLPGAGADVFARFCLRVSMKGEAFHGQTGKAFHGRLSVRRLAGKTTSAPRRRAARCLLLGAVLTATRLSNALECLIYNNTL
jgi:hypothetical protein